MITAIAPFISCHCDAADFEQALAEGYKEIYIRTTNGILKHHQLRGNNRFIRLKVDSIPGIKEPEIGQAMNFLPAGKIPYRLYEQIEAFFRKVIKVQGTALEAMIFILWNQEQGYHLYVPEQSVAAASVRFDPTSLPGGSTVVVNVHSHGTMSAFFSGTDDANDAELVQFSGVFGHFQNAVPSTVWRFNYYRTKFKAEVKDIFEEPAKQEIEVPQEWIEKVSKAIPATTYGRGGHSNQGNVVTPGRWDHLKPYQYQKQNQTGSQTGSANASQRQQSNNLRPNEVARTLAHTDLAFHGHDPEDCEMGIAVPANPHRQPTPTFSAPRLPGAAWKWNEESGGWRNVAGTDEANDPDVVHIDTAQECNEAADAAFARIVEDAYAEEVGGAGVGKPGSLSQAADRQLQLSLVSSEGDDIVTEGDPVDTDLQDLAYQYEAIAQRFGADVADAWWAIDQEMGELHEHPLLLQSLMMDMFGLLGPENQFNFFKDAYDNLTAEDQARIQTEGL